MAGVLMVVAGRARLWWWLRIFSVAVVVGVHREKGVGVDGDGGVLEGGSRERSASGRRWLRLKGGSSISAEARGEEGGSRRNLEVVVERTRIGHKEEQRAGNGEEEEEEGWFAELGVFSSGDGFGSGLRYRPPVSASVRCSTSAPALQHGISIAIEISLGASVTASTSGSSARLRFGC